MDYIHKEYPKTVGRKEFWKQIKRTVNDNVVSENDILSIVDQINKYLIFNKKDHLLDLGCGNAALANYFFTSINKYTGVDFSEYLLGVAKEFFNKDNVSYILDEAENFVIKNENSEIYTKILIYGVAAYLKKNSLINILQKIRKEFKNTKKIFIGNLPNKYKAQKFYKNRSVKNYDLNDFQSTIGIWWDPDELKKICNKIGFRSSIIFMPKNFYGSKYRFDILLSK